jgi:hypothetical protein
VSYAIITTANARLDVQEAISWENKRSEGLAIRFLENLEEKLTHSCPNSLHICHSLRKCKVRPNRRFSLLDSLHNRRLASVGHYSARFTYFPETNLVMFNRFLLTQSARPYVMPKYFCQIYLNYCKVYFTFGKSNFTA